MFPQPWPKQWFRPPANTTPRFLQKNAKKRTKLKLIACGFYHTVAAKEHAKMASLLPTLAEFKEVN